MFAKLILCEYCQINLNISVDIIECNINKTRKRSNRICCTKFKNQIKVKIFSLSLLTSSISLHIHNIILQYSIWLFLFIFQNKYQQAVHQILCVQIWLMFSKLNVFNKVKLNLVSFYYVVQCKHITLIKKNQTVLQLMFRKVYTF